MAPMMKASGNSCMLHVYEHNNPEADHRKDEGDGPTQQAASIPGSLNLQVSGCPLTKHSLPIKAKRSSKNLRSDNFMN